jgi:NADH-quinone oxidoreductase subunit A
VDDWVPVLVLLVFVVGFAAANIVISWALGQKGRETRAKNEPYECGIEAKTPARLRFSVKFYVVAMLFILFDIEVVFFYPWAAVYREGIGSGLGLYLFIVMLLFMDVLFLGWLYVVRKGALEWRS